MISRPVAPNGPTGPDAKRRIRSEVIIDATGWSNPRGEGRFLRGLLPALAAAAPDLRLRTVVEREQAEAVAMCLGGGHDVVPVGGAPGSRLASGHSRRPRDIRRLRASIRSTGGEVLLQPTLVGWFPAGVPQVLGVHDLKPAELAAEMLGSRRRRLAWTAKQRLALRSAESIFAVSEASRAAVAATTGRASDSIPIAPPAIAPAFRRRKAGEISAARDRVGLAPADRYVVYLSGLNPHKDPMTLIDAIALHRAAGGGVHAVLAGSWDAAYVGIGGVLRERADRLGLTDAVRLPGHLGDDVLAALLSGSDAVVSTSRHEGLGLPAVEAAACGAPVLLSDIPAHRETSGERAGFFRPGDVAQLAGLLDRLPPRANGGKPRSGPATNGSSDPYDFAPAAEAIACLLTSEPAKPGT